jgi:hypothetical protein
MTKFDTQITTELDRMIKGKIKYFGTLPEGKQAQFLQSEIMFLKNEVLPMTLLNTSIYYEEIVKYVILRYKFAMEKKLNGLLVYLPITDEYDKNVIIGFANPKENLLIGTPGALMIRCKEVEITNCDTTGGGVSIQPLNYPLNNLQ